MVKKYLLVLACMMAIVQHVEAQDYFSSASNSARLYVGEVEPQYPPRLWHDSPYYIEGTGTLCKISFLKFKSFEPTCLHNCIIMPLFKTVSVTFVYACMLKSIFSNIYLRYLIIC